MSLKRSNTCLAVIRHKGKLIFGADRRASWGFDQAQTMPIPKLAKRNGLLLAGTGGSFLCTLIVDVLNVPHYSPEMDTDIYMHNDFFRAVKKLMIDKGFCDEHKSLRFPEPMGAEIIVGINHKLYNVTIENMDPSNHHTIGSIIIDRLNTPYATGCGGQWAWGTLETLIQLEQEGLIAASSGKDKLTRALMIAAKYSPGCDAVFDFISE